MPLPELRRNLRSKTRWFTEFCNSHYVSHFAAFFIVTGAKISVVESCLWLESEWAEPTAHLALEGKVFGVGMGVTSPDTELRGAWCRARRSSRSSPAPTERGEPTGRGPTPSGRAAHQMGSRPKGGSTEVTGVDMIDSMILPQVHLRKPCYDFSFL